MRYLFAMMIILSGLQCGAQTQWKLVKTLHFDWAGSGHADTFVLESPSNSGVNGDFSRLRIQIPGKREYVLTGEDGMVNFRKDNCSFRFAFCAERNLIDSNYLLFLPVPGKRPLLFVFGYAYASSPGSLRVLAVGGDGLPYEMLVAKEFDLYNFVDLDGDGVPEIVGKKCMSQTWGNDFLTYDPYSVFTLPKLQGKKVTYSLALSKQYNLKHYYGWAGPDCREDYAVVLHPPSKGKPVVMRSKEAEKLFDKR